MFEDKSITRRPGEFAKFTVATALRGNRGSPSHDRRGPNTTAANAPAKRNRLHPQTPDISWLLEDEAQGAVYRDRGTQKDIFEILKSYRINTIRARVSS